MQELRRNRPKGARGIPVIQPGRMLHFGDSAASASSNPGGSCAKWCYSKWRQRSSSGSGQRQRKRQNHGEESFLARMEAYICLFRCTTARASHRKFGADAHRSRDALAPRVAGRHMRRHPRERTRNSIRRPYPTTTGCSVSWAGLHQTRLAADRSFRAKHMSARFEQGGEQEGPCEYHRPRTGSPRGRTYHASTFYQYVFGKIAEQLTKDPRVAA